MRVREPANERRGGDHVTTPTNHLSPQQYAPSHHIIRIATTRSQITTQPNISVRNFLTPFHLWCKCNLSSLPGSCSGLQFANVSRSPSRREVPRYTYLAHRSSPRWKYPSFHCHDEEHCRTLYVINWIRRYQLIEYTLVSAVSVGFCMNKRFISLTHIINIVGLLSEYSSLIKIYIITAGH